jgi:hypothetical protein
MRRSGGRQSLLPRPKRQGRGSPLSLCMTCAWGRPIVGSGIVDFAGCSYGLQGYWSGCRKRPGRVVLAGSYWRTSAGDEPVLVEGFADAPRGRGSDALVDAECLPEVHGGFGVVNVLKVSPA